MVIQWTWSASCITPAAKCAGVMTSDPRRVPAALPIPHLTFEEATELAFFGAAVLHPLAMQPALQNGRLDVRVKNSYNRRAAAQDQPFAASHLDYAHLYPEHFICTRANDRTALAQEPPVLPGRLLVSCRCFGVPQWSLS